MRLPSGPPAAPAFGLPLAIGLLAYARTLAFGFVWDDHHLIVTNTVVRQPSVVQVLASDFWQEGERTEFYRPLVSLSYFWEFRLWGLAPAGYHAGNLVAHLLAVAAVTATAFRLFGGSLAAAVSGLIFAVHPVHTEPVAFIAARSDLIACALAAGALCLHLRDRRLGSWLLFAGALLSKETAVMLPALLLLGDRLLRQPRDRWAVALGRLPPFLALTGAYLALRWVVFGVPVARPVDATPLAPRLVIALNALADYLQLAVLPLRAAPDRVPDAVLSVRTLAAAVALLVLAALAWLGRRRAPALPFLLAWFLLTLLPVSPLVPGQPPRVAERYLYIPSAAVAWFAGWALALLARCRLGQTPVARCAGMASMAALVLAALGVTVARCSAWRDDERLFTRMLAADPRSYVGALNLGYIHLTRGRLEDAEAHFRRALALRAAAGAPWLGLAVARSRAGDHDRAIAFGLRARALAPEGDLIHAQLGVIYGVAGRYRDAAGSFREAIRRNPRRLHPRAQLVLALADAGEADQAAEALREAERVIAATGVPDPTDVAMLARARDRLRAGVRPE
jgi:tetratricopeptide (TPR) repeat protein